MDIDNIRLKFLKSGWEEIIEIIMRLGVTQKIFKDLKILIQQMRLLEILLTNLLKILREMKIY